MVIHLIPAPWSSQMLTLCWFDVEPASATLAQRQTSTATTPRIRSYSGLPSSWAAKPSISSFAHSPLPYLHLHCRDVKHRKTDPMDPPTFTGVPSPWTSPDPIFKTFRPRRHDALSQFKTFRPPCETFRTHGRRFAPYVRHFAPYVRRFAPYCDVSPPIETFRPPPPLGNTFRPWERRFAPSLN